MREAARELAAEFGLELPREVGLDLALLETVLPLSKARRRKSSCILKRSLFKGVGRVVVWIVKRLSSLFERCIFF